MIYLAILSMFLLMNYIFVYVIMIFRARKKAKIPNQSVLKKISIVIPLRNEEDNISALIESLSRLSYPLELWEVIFVDDHSEDNSVNVLETHLQNLYFQHKFLKLKDKSGKKEALKLGFSEAMGDILLQSDADCTFSADWLHVHNRAYANSATKMACGAVLNNSESSIFQKFQQAEMMALMNTSRLAIENGNPIMCNAANLSFCKTVIPIVIESYQKTSHPSGDDVFMLHHLHQTYGSDSIVYLTHNESIVHTIAQSSFSKLLMQRSRWASKTSKYSSIFAQFFAFLVLGANFGFYFLLFYLLFFCTDNCTAFALALFSKFIIDGFLVITFQKKYDISVFKHQFLILVIMSFLYPAYIIIIMLRSLMQPIFWKGRKIG